MDIYQPSSQSFKNKDHLNNVDNCGCYYCQNIFATKDIDHWVDNQETALCPHCSVDAVIPFPQNMSLAQFEEKLLTYNKHSFQV